MPTPVAHALAGTGVYLAATRRHDVWLLAAAVVAAGFADLDFGLNFLTGKNYHHYFTHSLAFSTLFALAAYFLARLLHRPAPARDACILWVAYLTHLGLDMFSKDTSEPYGMEFWWPFSESFLIGPFVLFDDIWRGTLAKLLSAHNWLAVAREAAIVGPVVAIIWWWRRRQS